MKQVRPAFIRSIKFLEIQSFLHVEEQRGMVTCNRFNSSIVLLWSLLWWWFPARHGIKFSALVECLRSNLKTRILVSSRCCSSTASVFPATSKGAFINLMTFDLYRSFRSLSFNYRAGASSIGTGIFS